MPILFKTSGCLTSSGKRINAKVGEMVAQWQSVGQHMFEPVLFYFDQSLITPVVCGKTHVKAW